MPLDDDVLNNLAELLPSTTAVVLAGGKPFATAFFISDELLLTCAHSAPKDKEISIWPHGSDRSRPADVTWGAHPIDLALLHSPLRGGDKASPCVALSNALDNGNRRYLVAGCPVQSDGTLVWASPEVTGYPLQGLYDENAGLEFNPGTRVLPGMSGSPVASTQTGAVVAIIERVHENPEDAHGGQAVPVSLAAREFREVKDLLMNPDTEPAMVKWRNALGPDDWRWLGKHWHVGKYIDLHIQGERQKWEIGTDPPPASGHPRSGPDLGPEVAEAIFSWAQGHRTSGPEEARLLGHLLGSALFPAPLQAQMDRLGRADDVLVRLHVAADSRLTDIPWELAAVPHPDDHSLDTAGKRRRFIAADPAYHFVRVTRETTGHPNHGLRESPYEVTVFAVAPQPAHWRYRAVGWPPERRPTGWFKSAETRQQLRAAIAGANFKVFPESPVTPSANGELPLTYARFKNALRTAKEHGEHYDVIHYLGTRRKANEQEEIMFEQEDRSALLA